MRCGHSHALSQPRVLAEAVEFCVLRGDGAMLGQRSQQDALVQGRKQCAVDPWRFKSDQNLGAP